eukprot:gnl/Dysnectes_brevis/9822_a18646_222.p1 GENE.gnl/Dysnectes_brevis/9822_a18646_222~~gnl/Dysnectes_brevis/9822_a18646_222.p1  ORF type:complete len:185 (-),score=36.83 gnl/Dysnectes_brevis/9822_a18646_222:73-627(-)
MPPKQKKDRPKSSKKQKGKSLPPTSKQEELPSEGTHKFIFYDGSVYDGEYITEEGSRVRHGQGTFIEHLCQEDPHKIPGMDPIPPKADGHPTQVFNGRWEMDRFVEGSITYADGSRFEGSLNAEGEYAEGKYVWSDGSSYEGGWRDSQMHGEGLFVSSEGVHWMGVYERNCGASCWAVNSGPEK